MTAKKLTKAQIDTKKEALKAARLLLDNEEPEGVEEPEIKLMEKNSSRKTLGEYLTTIFKPRSSRPFCGHCGRLIVKEVKN